MARHHYPSDPSSPKDNSDVVINFSEASRERVRKTDVPIEQFLLSDEGREEMAELYATIDNSGFIIRTLSMKLEDTVRDMVHDFDPSIYSLFLHDDGAQALTRLELIDLYRTNPLINTTLWKSRRKFHEGDFKAQQMYTFGLRVFMNMVRYEWLLRTYDAQDPRWQDRAERLGDFRGSQLHLHLKPGFQRGDIVPRRHTPSDYLENIPEE